MKYAILVPHGVGSLPCLERCRTLETQKNPCHALRPLKSNRTAVGLSRASTFLWRLCKVRRGWPGQAHGCPVHVEPQFSMICRESSGGGLCNCLSLVKSFRCIRLVRTSLVVSSRVCFSCDILVNIRSSRKAINATAI